MSPSLYLPRIITITSNSLPLAPWYGVSHSPLSSCIFYVMKRKKGSPSNIISSLHRTALAYILTTACSRNAPMFLFVFIPSRLHYVHVILISIAGNWWTSSIDLGGEGNQVVDNPGPMENEEQATEETGETHFGNVLGTRIITFFALFILLSTFFTINYQQLMLYKVIRALN